MEKAKKKQPKINGYHFSCRKENPGDFQNKENRERATRLNEKLSKIEKEKECSLACRKKPVVIIKMQE